MEQYIKTMQNADREAGIITDRANRYARDLAEIDENTIYTPDYKEKQRQLLARLPPSPMFPTFSGSC